MCEWLVHVWSAGRQRRTVSLGTGLSCFGATADRQRGFTNDEVDGLADIFNIPAWQLTTRCANCEGYPPAGFSCVTCGAGQERPYPGGSEELHSKGCSKRSRLPERPGDVTPV